MSGIKDNKIIKIICILFIISIIVMGYLLLFCNLSEISNRVYLNIIDYFTYLDNILLSIFFFLSFINGILILIFTFKENKKEI